MSNVILLDTDIVIDFLRGYTLAVTHLKNYADSISFSTVTVAEIYSGVKGTTEAAKIERLFTIFPVIDITKEIAREAGLLVNRYRASHAVEIPDALIAATCIVTGAQLHTLNTKHYPMFEGLEPPYYK